jgi:hypothetical protein
MDWSQISVGAILGSAGTWIAGVTRSLIDLWIQERGKDKDEQRRIRAEQRTEERDAELKKQEAAVELTHDKHTLLRIKTHLRGASSLLNGAHELQELHAFFERHPRYIEVAANRAFLEKWPKTLYAEVAAGLHEAVMTGRDSDAMLKKLKAEVEGLTLA